MLQQDLWFLLQAVREQITQDCTVKEDEPRAKGDHSSEQGAVPQYWGKARVVIEPVSVNRQGITPPEKVIRPGGV